MSLWGFSKALTSRTGNAKSDDDDRRAIEAHNETPLLYRVYALSLKLTFTYEKFAFVAPNNMFLIFLNHLFSADVLVLIICLVTLTRDLNVGE